MAQEKYTREIQQIFSLLFLCIQIFAQSDHAEKGEKHKKHLVSDAKSAGGKNKEKQMIF